MAAPDVGAFPCNPGDVAGNAVQGLQCVVFDVGETLVDESRLWISIANQAGVPVFTVCAILGGLIERGESHGRLWDLLGIERVEPPVIIEHRDLYPDALDCIAAARRLQLKVGIAGNQRQGLEGALNGAGLAADFIGSSAAWGVAKPNHDFFERIITEAQVPASAILYVGDRLDNDVLPAHRVGMRTAHIRRGPWGYLHALRAQSAIADLHIDSLHDLVTVLR